MRRGYCFDTGPRASSVAAAAAAEAAAMAAGWNAVATGRPVQRAGTGTPSTHSVVAAVS